MITLLSRLFIKDGNTDDPKVRTAYGTLCGIVGIVLNVLLFAGKYFAGFISGSIAIMADAINNLSDAGSSLITLAGFRIAEKRPDRDHPFGHGRAEYLSAMAVAVIIILMGVELAKSSISKIMNPEEIETDTVVFVVLIASILVKVYMVVYNRQIAKKIDSSAMKATSVDSISDVAATFAVLIAVTVQRFAVINLDGICGLIVSLFILYAGIGVVRDTISPLLGQPPKPEFVDKIYQIVMAHEGITGVHDLVVHDYGPGRVMISLHAEVPGDGDIFVIHDLIDRVENELNEKLGCEAVIHMDPVETDNDTVNETKKIVAGLVKKIDDEMTIHDFRMVTGETHTNLIFDVVAPYSIKDSDDQIKERISKIISEYNSTYNVVIHIDRNYVK